MALLCSALAWQREEGQRLALEFQASLAHRQVERAQRQVPADGQFSKAFFFSIFARRRHASVFLMVSFVF